VAGLTHRYGERVVLDNVSFDLAAGEVVAIVGPSGAGKTTLFRCITRLISADAGRVELAGRDLAALSGAELRRARRDIGLVFQQYNLVRRMSALDNVLSDGWPTWRPGVSWFACRVRGAGFGARLPRAGGPRRPRLRSRRPALVSPGRG